MKRNIFLCIVCITTSNMNGITTISPDQPSMDYLEPEAQALGIDRTWVLALKGDPIIRAADQKSTLATPQEGKNLWLEAANTSAALGKMHETRYCLYRRLTFMQEWSAMPFMWAFFIDFGQQLQQATSKEMPRNPLSIAIANNNTDFVETIMPKDGSVIAQLSAPIQIFICFALMALTLQAVERAHIPIISTMIDRIKKYNLWDYPTVQALKPRLLLAAANNPEVKQILNHAGIV